MYLNRRVFVMETPSSVVMYSVFPKIYTSLKKKMHLFLFRNLTLDGKFSDIATKLQLYMLTSQKAFLTF